MDNTEYLKGEVEYLRKKILRVADIFIDLLNILKDKDAITDFEHRKLMDSAHMLAGKIDELIPK